jgi:phytoene desaturase
MRVAVVGAGVGGLACAVRLAAAGHAVTVLEQAPAAGGKAGRVELSEAGRTWRFDSGPSLLTMPWVLQELCAQTGTPRPELIPVEPVTHYHFADGSTVDLSADHAASVAALDRWSPGSGADWTRFLRICAAMWRASGPFLTGPPPWPPRRPGPGEAPPDPRDALRVRPWHTVSSLARSVARDPRLRMVIERFATYAGADPRRAPAALVLAGYVEHAFGAWHVPGGLYGIVEALTGRLAELGGVLRTGTPVLGVVRDGARVTGVRTLDGLLAADAVVFDGDARALEAALRGGDPHRRRHEPSVSGLALMLALEGRTPGLVHHQIRFPADYHAEFDDLFAHRRPVRDPTLYLSASCATVPAEAPEDGENWFVLVNAPAGVAADWEAEADRVVAALGVGARVVARHVRSPASLEAETGAVGGAIYGDAPHGRLATLRRPGPRVPGVRGLFRVGGTAHPGGGLPLVMLGAAHVAGELGPA